MHSEETMRCNAMLFLVVTPEIPDTYLLEVKVKALGANQKIFIKTIGKRYKKTNQRGVSGNHCGTLKTNIFIPVQAFLG